MQSRPSCRGATSSIRVRVPSKLLPAALLGIAVALAGVGRAAAEPPGLTVPAPVGPFLNGVFPARTPRAPGSTPWRVVDAFPGLPIANASVIAPNPADERLYVGSLAGVVVSFANDAQVTSSEPFLDLSDRVALVSEGGLFGLAFHPEFGQAGSPHRGRFYAYYSSHCPLDAERDGVDLAACDPSYPREPVPGFFGTWLRLSRFEARFDPSAGVWRGDPASEEPMLSIRLHNWGHRGGGLVFGADGLLYLTIGDQVGYDTAQDIVSSLDGGALRLEVGVAETGDGFSCPAGSHLPRRRFQDVSPNPDEVSGRFYCIPDDNPWLDPMGGLYEEYFTIGHRNPYRLSLDPATGRLWSGDVGELTREEINVLVKGGNYGWPFREGRTSGPRQPPAVMLGELIEPVIDFTRDEAGALIGGYVYFGTRFPELRGRFIAGDFLSRNLWAIELDPVAMTASKELLGIFDPGQLVTFGQDKQGEIYLGSIAPGVPLQRLERLGEPVPDPPARLSALGAFSDLPSLTAHPAAVPYDLVPFWSDGAEKRRWIFLPNDGRHDEPEERIAFSESGNWSFPVGTVLMKHFELPLDADAPSAKARLETRFLVLGEDRRWYGVTYRWRDDGSDADLLTTAETRELTVRLAGGGTEPRSWSFPSRAQCTTCHNTGAGGALGPRTHQLNRAHFYPQTGRIANQLHTWSALGMLDPPLTEAELPGLLAGARLDDVTASLEHRARSWLDANCSYCHRPETGNRAGFDARLTTPLALQGLVWGEVIEPLGIPDAYLVHPGDPFASLVFHRAAAVGAVGMPPLAKSRVDAEAVALLSAWIQRVRPGFPRAGIAYDYYEVNDLVELPDFEALTPQRSGSLGSFDISVRGRESDYAFRFHGVVEVPASGAWTFTTGSDDGSQLFVDGALVVDNDGLHGSQERSGTLALDAGFHAIVVTMFERTGGEQLAVEWEGPGVPRQSIPAARLFREVPAPVSNAPPVLADPGAQVRTPGQSVQLALSASDVDGDPLYYDASGLPPRLALDAESGLISGTLVPGVEGTHLVTASASDGVEVSVVSFPWLVSRFALANPGPRLGAVGDAVRVALEISPAGGTPLEFSASGLPPGLALDAENGEIAGTLLRTGRSEVVLQVSNGVDTAQAAFTWTVRNPRTAADATAFEATREHLRDRVGHLRPAVRPGVVGVAPRARSLSRSGGESGPRPGGEVATAAPTSHWRASTTSLLRVAPVRQREDVSDAVGVGSLAHALDPLPAHASGKALGEPPVVWRAAALSSEGPPLAREPGAPDPTPRILSADAARAPREPSVKPLHAERTCGAGAGLLLLPGLFALRLRTRRGPRGIG